MPRWITELPWWVRLPGFVAGFLMSAFATKFPDGFQALGLYAGLVLALWTAGATAWHRADLWRIGRGKPRVRLEPSHLIIIGLAIAVVGMAWQLYQGPKVIKEVVQVPIAATPPPAKPSPPRQLTAYEKEQRLRAVDEIYNIMATQLTPAWQEGRNLFNQLLPIIGDETAKQLLSDHANKVEAGFVSLSGVLKKYEYFSDIVQIPLEKPVFNGLAETNAARNLAGTIGFLRMAVRPEYVGQALDRDVTLLEARNANREYGEFLERTKPLLQQKRSEIESTVIGRDSK
jgi:hypothetical protein